MVRKEPSLPVNRAFVVQLGVEAEVEKGRVEGRVEHMVSGQATHFHSWEELLGFMEGVLTGIRDRLPKGANWQREKK